MLTGGYTNRGTNICDSSSSGQRDNFMLIGIDYYSRSVHRYTAYVKCPFSALCFSCSQQYRRHYCRIYILNCDEMNGHSLAGVPAPRSTSLTYPVKGFTVSTHRLSCPARSPPPPSAPRPPPDPSCSNPCPHALQNSALPSPVTRLPEYT